MSSSRWCAVAEWARPHTSGGVPGSIAVAAVLSAVITTRTAIVAVAAAAIVLSSGLRLGRGRKKITWQRIVAVTAAWCCCMASSSG